MQDHSGHHARPSDPLEVVVYLVLGLAFAAGTVPDLLEWVAP